MPTEPSSASSNSGSEFDEFYLASRRRLVLETYALTGDLAAARSAVRDAFEAAGHHWRKVGLLPDPEEWVRPRAWAMAQRRHVARLWHREKGLSAEQKNVLDALHHLPDQQRKVLLLANVAGFTTPDIGRELGESVARVEHQLTVATRSFGKETGTPAEGVLEAIESLAPIAEATALPSAPVVERAGRRRRRVHAVGGIVVLLALTLAGGLFVVRGGVEKPVAAANPGPAPKPVTEEMLLSLAQVVSVVPGPRWRVVDTSENTSGSGINTVCQQRRFADPRGRDAFIRKFAAAGKTRRRYLETIEISRTPAAAASAYRTTLGWFAGCSEARLQLLNAYRVRGLGERAQMLALRIPNHVGRTYVVGVVQTGSVTVSTVMETINGRPIEVSRAARGLTAAVRNLCDADPAGLCPRTVEAAPVLPPPSGEAPGTLAVADLPVVGSINQPWVGTDPVRARPNIAATTCDKANFIRSGAPRAATRTFLIPQGKLPRRFGIAETVGLFANPRKARAFVARVSAAMAACEKEDLGAEVSSEVAEPQGYRRSQYALWRLDSEINEKSTVGFWMGVARVGRYVAQVNFTPTGDNDIDEVTFRALLTRARDRLFELPASP